MSEQRTEYKPQGFNEKELKKEFWKDYQYTHLIKSSGIKNGEIEIDGVGSVTRFNFIITKVFKEPSCYGSKYEEGTESKLICCNGKLLVSISEIPLGFNIDLDGNCSNCFMGTVQRFKIKSQGYNDALPGCSEYTFVEGYVMNEQNQIHMVTIRLTGIGSKPFNEIQKTLTPSDELVVSVGGDSRKKEFKFEVAKQKQLEPYVNLPVRFKENMRNLFEVFFAKQKELLNFRESISPYSKDGLLDFDGSSESQLPDESKVPAIGYDEPTF